MNTPKTLSRSTLAILISAVSVTQMALAAPTINPAPEEAERGSIESQLKRYRGQTEFLNPQPYVSRRFLERAMPESAARASTGGARRAVQESDVFKVADGKKLLYLLNNYRGLQVVSFVEGAEKPKLLGRVQSTGNYPRDMYIDQDQDRLIVLESYWFDAESGSYSRQQSRLVIYDVKDPASPKISQILPFEGEIADSRMVGDVLYVATTVRPRQELGGELPWEPRRETKTEATGLVYSVGLTEEKVHIVDSQGISLPISRRENMNIIEVEASAGVYQYYLVAVLSESVWGWWDRQSHVEVVDISDEKGAIKPLMAVSAKGAVRERSQTSIKDGTLIVVSNYQSPSDPNRRLRVAVETFTLPTEKSETITADEAEFRRLYIERELKKYSGEEAEEKRKELLADKELGLQGLFVKSDETLKKLVADSVVTVGDTQGLSASLRDVRFENDLLYVFWVPANNIDPFDLFDISEPHKEVKYLRRLQFDGWIDKAFPIEYKGTKYVIGLGWIIDNENNEFGRRSAQAMLFELIEKNGQYRALDITSMKLGHKNLWTDFNRGDKFFDIRFNANGEGVIMFQMNTYEGGSYKSGGKLLGFDLEAAHSGQEGKVFEEGAFLVAESSWLRRVFRNTEIDRINTFSDQELAVFGPEAKVGGAKKVEKAVASLELARDIQAYTTVQLGKDIYGVQVVNQRLGGDYYNTQTQLRVVGADHADAELNGKSPIFSLTGRTATLPGSYRTHAVTADKSKLLIFTHQTKRVKTGETSSGRPQYEYKAIHHLAMYQVVPRGGLVQLAKRSIESKERELEADLFRNWGVDLGLHQLVNGDWLTYLDTQLVVLDKNTLADSAVAIARSCDPGFTREERAGGSQLRQFGNQYFVQHTKRVADDKKKELSWHKNYLQELKIDGASATCGPMVNIPGKVLSVQKGGSHLIADDLQLMDRIIVPLEGEEGKTEEQFVTESQLLSLKLTASTATLVDDYKPDFGQKQISYGWGNGDNQLAGRIQALGNGEFVYLSTSEEQSFGWWGVRGGMGLRGPFLPRQTRTNIEMKIIGFDGDLMFTEEQRRLDLELGLVAQGTPSLQAIIPADQTGKEQLLVVGAYRGVQVLKWNVEEKAHPVAQELQLVQPNGQPSEEAQKVVYAPGARFYSYFGYGQSGEKYHYTPEIKSIEWASGLSGVTQVMMK